MKHHWMVWGAALLLVSLVGCKSAAPPPPVEEPVMKAEAPKTQEVAPPPPAPVDTIESHWYDDPDLVKVNEEARKQGLIGDIYFDLDRAAIKEQAQAQLAKNAAFFEQHPDFVVRLEGHGDDRGTNEYNLALGHRRAQAARDHLGGLGLKSDRLKMISYGEQKPQCTVPAESCWWRNRRVQFVIVGRSAG